MKFRQHIGKKWIQLKQDEQTLNFLEHCYDKSDWVLTQLYHSIATSVLNWFMTKTSINGLLRRGSMFVFSTAHFGQLLHATSAREEPPTCACAFHARCPCIPLPPPPMSSKKAPPPSPSTTSEIADSFAEPTEETPRPPRPRLLKTLLDLGAGDGEVTANMAPYFERVFATETSKVMQWRLEEKGYVVLDPFTWTDADLRPAATSPSSASSAVAPRYYDVIACLNLLDRCSKPLALLHQIYDRLEPFGGRLVVALVLPFHPYVEFGPLSPEPEEKLLVDGETIEEQINSLVDSVFAPIGFSLEALTRLPYLCEGDLSQAFYVLEDVVFVFRKNGKAGEASKGEESGHETVEGASGEVKDNATTIDMSAEDEGHCERREGPNL